MIWRWSKLEVTLHCLFNLRGLCSSVGVSLNCALTFIVCVYCTLDVNLGSDCLLLLAVSTGEMCSLIHGVHLVFKYCLYRYIYIACLF